MRRANKITHFAVSAALMATASVAAWGQTFSSGSTGVDGALNISTPGTVIFDPVALGIDTDGDNIFHFTTVKIGSQTHLIFKASKMRRPGPVVFLATGEVEINGWMDLDGGGGHPFTASDSVRRPSEPGPGGFPGGAGAKGGGQPQPGAGPGGAQIPISASQWPYAGCSASHAGLASEGTLTNHCTGKIADTYGSSLLLPLMGGSGGSGGFQQSNGTSAGGGAGGGAIRISSTTAIRLRPASPIVQAPQISARGGSTFSNGGGPGSGGAIHLQAPTVELSQYGLDACCAQPGLSANGWALGGSTEWGTSGDGRIRIDATTRILNNYLITPPSADGPLKSEPLPLNVPRVRISSIDGQNIAETAGGAYPLADVTLDNLNSIQIQVAASYVPVGTSMTLFISTETSGANQTVTTTPLTGTLASSTASATITLPRGVTVLYLRATW